MLVETLEIEMKQQSGEVREGTVSQVLDCCRFILQAPTLACTITSRLDMLVSAPLSLLSHSLVLTVTAV